MAAGKPVLDAQTRRDLRERFGAPPDLLTYLEAEYDQEAIRRAFLKLTVPEIAERVGYPLSADEREAYQAFLAQAAEAAADAAAEAAPRAPAEPAVRAEAPPRAPRPQPVAARPPATPRGTWYNFGLESIALLFALGFALAMWRIDGYFGVNFARGIPGLSTIPNTVFWPPVWTWVLGLGISAMQGAFWPRRAVYTANGTLLKEGSSLQEIITWLFFLGVNVGSSALGMKPIIAGMNLAGIVVPAEGQWLWGTAWVLAFIFALYPEWAARVFGIKLWHLWIPRSRPRFRRVAQ
ncbi:hypothetical protein EYB53_023990 [Candidatus Chloroploca sp. M-50]|uniref:Uncharacterized protein n=1 Tax=Candidatus Chloroploca mongolica TaxID=2528176 RepID=A0ABS4DH94_9CHLR|nr:hypothetical protein [Candidatus Chloroploca mongolica]MBP1468793.1 hypothetical protein [Candidatus Chloroploca mongolica]